MITKDKALTTDHVNEVRKCFGLSPFQPAGPTRSSDIHHVNWNQIPYGVGVLWGATHHERTMDRSTCRLGNIKLHNGTLKELTLNEHRRVTRFVMPADNDSTPRFVELGRNPAKVSGTKYADHGKMVSKIKSQVVDHQGSISWITTDSEPVGLVVPGNSGMRGLRDRTFIGLPIGTVIHQTTDGSEEPFMIIGKRYFYKTPCFVGVGLESLTVYQDICPRLDRSNRRGRLTNIKVATLGMGHYGGVSIVLPTDNMLNLAISLYQGHATSRNDLDFKSALVGMFDWSGNGNNTIVQEIELAAANDWAYWDND